MPQSTYVTARLDPEEKFELHRIAERERRTISQVARFAIQEFLDKRRGEPTPKGKAK